MKATAITVLVASLGGTLASQGVSRLLDTDPRGNGNAIVWKQAGARSWATDASGQIWQLDGTPQGNRRFAKLPTGATPREFVELGDRLLVFWHDGLLVIDDTGKATEILPNKPANFAYFDLGRSFEFQGRFLFDVVQQVGFPTPSYTYTRYETDGTLAGTKKSSLAIYTSPWMHGDKILWVEGVAAPTLYSMGPDLKPIALTSSTYPGTPFTGGTAVGSRFYFVKRVSGSQWEVWVTDGTPAGTTLLPSPTPHGRLDPFGVIGGELHLYSGPELWKTNGTSGIARLGTLPSYPSYVQPVRDGIFFTAQAPGGNGTEPYFTDGTIAGTVFLGDLTPGGGDSRIWQTFPLGGRSVLFRGTIAGIDAVWISDGTPSNTRRLVDLDASFGTTAAAGVLTRGRYIFAATDKTGDREVFVIDGVATAQQRGTSSPRSSFAALTATPFRAGASMSVEVGWAPRSSAGFLVIGVETAWETPVFGSSRLYVDLARPFVLLPAATDATGRWMHGANVPPTAPPGMTFALQHAVGPTAGPGGVDLSNAVLVTSGT